MSIKYLNRCVCDLCDHTEDVPADQIPKGWVKFDTEGQLDRSWITHIVCNSCVERIASVINGIKDDRPKSYH